MMFLRLIVVVISLLALGACAKPIPFQLADTDLQAPLEGVRIYRHSVSIFTPLPTHRAPIETDFQGAAIVPIPPNPTCLTFLRQGYEPTSIAIFRTIPPGVDASGPGAAASAADTDASAPGPTDTAAPSAESCPVPPRGVGDPCAAWQRVLCWDDLMPEVPVGVRMRPVHSEPVEVFVADERGAPIPDCEVLGATFLYLPVPGVEPEWGLPALQRTTTDAAGRATVLTWSGFRNRITARTPDRAEDWTDLEGSQRTSVRLSPRPLLWRAQRFKVIDPKSRPIAGAQISYGEIRNGLPESPNAFITETDRDGLTPTIAIPNADPLLLRVVAKGWKERTVAPLWRALDEGGTTRVMLESR